MKLVSSDVMFTYLVLQQTFHYVLDVEGIP